MAYPFAGVPFSGQAWPNASAADAVPVHEHEVEEAHQASVEVEVALGAGSRQL